MTRKTNGPGLAPMLALALLVGAVVPASAVTVRTWSQGTGSDFATGTLDGAAIGTDGAVRIGPVLETVWGPDTGVVWQVLATDKDGVWIARSDPAQVLHVAPDGTAQIVWEGEEGELVTTVARLPKGRIVFGVSPRGRVLLVGDDGKTETIVETGSEYVWALAVDGDGDLWVGAGSPGAVFRRSRNGSIAKVHDTGDDPVRSLAGLSKGGAVAGTGNQGLVLRLASSGETFALFDASEQEIVAVAQGEDGSVLALGAASPRKTRPAAKPSAPEPDNGRESEERDEANRSTSVRVTLASSGTGQPSKSSVKKAAPAGPSGGALYRITADGGVETMWSATQGLPWALLPDGEGGALVATGDAGRVVRVDERGSSAVMLRIPSSRATALDRDGRGTIWVGGGSDARLVSVGPGLARKGSYVTRPIDAGWVADWGAVVWDGETPRDSSLTVRVRAGNSAEPDDTWTGWLDLPASAPARTAASPVPTTRWCQVQVEMSSGGSGLSPVLRSLSLSYRTRNRPPKIESLTVQPPGLAWRRAPTQQGSRYGMLTADDAVAREALKKVGPVKPRRGPVRRSYEPGVRTFTWQAKDPDGDRIEYSLELSREGETSWFPIAADVAEEFYSWDARGLPDGTFRVRLTASDGPDNARGFGQLDRRVSDPFDVDSTAPVLELIDVETSAGTVTVQMVARDPGGSIASFEFRVNAADWTLLDPEDGVADSEEENYTLRVGDGGAPPRVMVRVVDRSGNVTMRMVDPAD